MGDPAPPTGGDLAPLLAEIRQLKRRITDMESASGTQRGQVLRDLVGRVSYSTQDSSVVGYTSTQPADQPFGPVLKFTIEEARWVSVEFNVRGAGQARADTTASLASVWLIPGLMLDGVFLDYLPNAGINISTGNGSGSLATMRYTNTEQMLTARALVSLQAGEHTVRGGWRTHSLTLSGSGSVSSSLARPQLFVDVLQTAG